MESISRISSLLETARDLTLEAARDAGSARRATAARPLPTAQIKKLLDSRNEREVMEGMKKVITMHYSHQQPTSPYLTSTINALAHPSPALKRLISIHLLAHAEAQPDTALLSINALQKALSDPAPATRALALRTMSAVRVPAVSAIVALGVRRGAADLHAAVRRAAAFAAAKCVRLDAGMRTQMVEVLEALLADREHHVVGAAVAAWREVCGRERWAALHRHYRGLVRKLVDMDEWGQVATLEVLVAYARRCFPRRVRRVTKKKGVADGGEVKKDALKGFYDDVEDAATTTPPNAATATSPTDEHTHRDEDGEEMEEIPILDPDLDLLLRSASPLLHSRNSAVVLAVAKTYLYLAPPHSTYLRTAVGPLIALLRAPSDIRQLALRNIEHLALTHAGLFAPYAAHFLVRAVDDPTHVAPLKLSILSLLFPAAPARTRALILTELAHLARTAAGATSTSPHDDDEANASAAPLARAALRAVARCAHAAAASHDAATTARCMAILHAHLASPSAALVSDALDGLRALIARDPSAHARTTVVRLAASLDAARGGPARASVVWLVGEFAGVCPEDNVAADVLRLLLRGFADEEVEVRAQIVLLAAKVYVQHLNLARQQRGGGGEVDKAEAKTGEADAGSGGVWADQTDASTGWGGPDVADIPTGTVDPTPPEKEHPIAVIWRAVLLLARYDTSYDVRDRARVYRALLARPDSTELASLLLLAPKPAPTPQSPAERRRDCVLGGAALVVGQEGGVWGLSGEDGVPDWVEPGEEPDPRLRDGDEAERKESARVGRENVAAGERLDAATAVATPAEKVSVAKGNPKTLDDWLAEDEQSDAEESEETEEEETESGEEESEYESDEDEEGDEQASLVK